MQPNTSPPDLSLVDVQLAFAHWRKTRSGREATPHRLKQMAVRLLATESRASVCKALPLTPLHLNNGRVPIQLAVRQRRQHNLLSWTHYLSLQ